MKIWFTTLALLVLTIPLKAEGQEVEVPPTVEDIFRKFPSAEANSEQWRVSKIALNRGLQDQCPQFCKWLMKAKCYERKVVTFDPLGELDNEELPTLAPLVIRFLFWENTIGEPRCWLLYPRPTESQIREYNCPKVLLEFWHVFGEISIPDRYTDAGICSIAPFRTLSRSKVSDPFEQFRSFERYNLLDGDKFSPFPFNTSLVLALRYEGDLFSVDTKTNNVSLLAGNEPDAWKTKFGLDYQTTDRFHVTTSPYVKSPEALFEVLAARQLRWLAGENPGEFSMKK